MKYFILILLSFTLIACGSIEEENVGVRTTFTKKILDEELQQGFYTAWTSNVREYTGKEIKIDLKDMTPKAGDNLSLTDFDADIYYKVDRARIAEMRKKYTDADAYSNDLWFSGWRLVRSQARSTIYDTVQEYDSLVVHKNRPQISSKIKQVLQDKLDADDPNYFKVTRVIIRNVVTDPSIEDNIKMVIAEQKRLEAKEVELKTVRKQKAINLELSESLTPAILKQRELDVQMAAIEKGVAVNMILGGAQPVFNVNRETKHD